ncbi:unnamed protein product [Dicrocoelium dendriticum]|nr:unnamed protein product [Dicrocoelium dendriticum]
MRNNADDLKGRGGGGVGGVWVGVWGGGGEGGGGGGVGGGGGWVGGGGGCVGGCFDICYFCFGGCRELKCLFILVVLKMNNDTAECTAKDVSSVA